MILLSKERQELEIQREIDECVAAIKAIKESGSSKMSIKKLEKRKESLEMQLKALAKMKRDDMLTFEQLGIDCLFVDEAHEFKNLFTLTKLENVAGIGNTPSKKAQDLYMKCRYLDEKTGNRGTVLATGTPATTP